MARRWLPPTTPTPFQALLMDYMRNHWPMDLARLAERLQIPATTVHGWFYAGRIPHASTLRQVALATGIPLAVLYRASGYDVPAAEPVIIFPPTVSPLLDSLELTIRDMPDLPPRARSALLGQIESFRRGEVDQYGAQKRAEHRVIEAEPARTSLREATGQANGDGDTGTHTQHEEPEVATRMRTRRRREAAHRQPAPTQ